MTAQYDYDAVVRRVVDGDTLDLTLTRDIGFHLATTATIRVRLVTVDTPERGQPGWAEASRFVHAWIMASVGLRAETYKTDSFGRWLADLYRADDRSDTLTQALLRTGHAVPYQR